MAGTVWVVEFGEYSDYRVAGVYTTKENAQLVADAINASGHTRTKATIAEWPLDPSIAELHAGYARFLVELRYDGTVERADLCELRGGNITSDFQVLRRSTWKAPSFRNEPDVIQGEVFAADRTHAIKIVNEKRIQLIASGEFQPTVTET